VAQTSQFGLEIRLPAAADEPVRYRTAGGREQERLAGPPPAQRRVPELWRELRESSDPRSVLQRAGADLSAWLLGEWGAGYLSDRLPVWRGEPLPRRIELRVPAGRAEWPWELATVEGLDPLAVHPALTVVRVATTTHPDPEPVRPPLFVEVVAVTLDHGGWPPLAAGAEAERVRVEVAQAGAGGRFDVQIDPLGGWDALVDRCERLGPPHVLHFAGHGLEDGRGLVFRDGQGGPEEVEAARIASLLARPGTRGPTWLAFLNACETAAGDRTVTQPFGGLGRMLVRHGLPVVVGVLTPIRDADAVRLARRFYRGVSRGDGVDCALQAARRDLFLAGGSAWPFVVGTCKGEPGPLWEPPGLRARPSQRLHAFGHRRQRQQLEDFLLRKRPITVVVHGEAGTGHRYVAERVRHDLEREGNVLWKPVAEMRWLASGGEPMLARSQLAAEVARALGIPDTGTLEELEARLGKAIADRCVEGQVVVLDLVQVLCPADADQGKAVETLVCELWPALMGRALKRRRELPVYLLVSVATPRAGQRPSRKLKRRIESIRRTVGRLEEQRRQPGGLRVEVLDELEPFSTDRVADFLENVLELDPDEADRRAEVITAQGDNETILRLLEGLLNDWETP